MGEPVKLEGRELAEVIERAALTVEAIGLDEENPARLAAAEVSLNPRSMLDEVVRELDLFAIALVTVKSHEVEALLDVEASRKRIREIEQELADQLALNVAIASAAQEINHV